MLIYTDIIEGDSININLLIKGAGSENYSTLKMFKPSASKEEIFEFIKQSVITAGEKSCPPLVLGLGIGSTMDAVSYTHLDVYKRQVLCFVQQMVLGCGQLLRCLTPPI